jgi:hypothetical protein
VAEERSNESIRDRLKRKIKGKKNRSGEITPTFITTICYIKNN